jgi:glycosyltransferase involved in cell wall biosynthesis
MFDAVRMRLARAGKRSSVIDVSAVALDRRWSVHFWRFAKVLGGLGRITLLTPSAGDALYMSVSGGFGQFYELAFAAIARVLRLRVFLSHCSYAYLDRRSALARFLFAIAGSRATHVVLSVEMGARLRHVYPACTRTLVVSNAAFVEPTVPEAPKVRKALKSIGFISNISAKKGVFEYLEVARRIESLGWHLSVKLAGPFDDAETEARVRNALKSLPSVEYVGPRYAAEKAEFFSKIDVLLFPTKYVNEASPVTLHEAMGYGLPVIAYNRGAISELVVEGCGLLVAPGDNFVEAAVQQIGAWRTSPPVLELASSMARRQFERMCECGRRQWAELEAELYRT